MTDAQPKDWRAAMWALYDMSIYGVSRLRTFHRLRKCGLSPREAAEEIQLLEREP